VTAAVGLTDVTVDYSSPAVKGRKIWGEVVPLGEVWRAGANASTKVTFSTDASIDGKPVPAGTYAFYAIPAADKWTVILSKDTSLWGSDGYKPANDLLRVQVAPQAIPHRERMAFEILDVTDEGATLSLEWEKVRVAVPFKVDTNAAVLRAIRALAGDDWRPYNSGARWLLEHAVELPLANELADKSLKLKEEWQNLWKAELLAQKGDKAQARKLALKAQELGQKAQNFFQADRVAKAIADWK
jgi:hypothetical protein